MTGGLDLPALDPLLGFQLLWGFVRVPWKRLHVSSAHDLFLLRTRCLLSSWPSAYQSILSLMIYPQITFPFELFGLSST